MNKINYLFLDAAIGIPVFIKLLSPSGRSILSDVIYPPQKLTNSQIIEILNHLFQDGLISAITQKDLDSLDPPLVNKLLTKGFKPSQREIEAALESKENLSGYEFPPESEYEKNLCYFLTPKGGELWESVSHPKWEQYLHRGHPIEPLPKHYFREGDDDTINCILWCADCDLGAKVVEIEDFLLEDPDSQYSFHYIKGSQIWETLTPWHPTYWKTLPCGYVVTYQVKHFGIKKSTRYFQKSLELVEMKKPAESWYTNIVTWYTNYYQQNEN